MKLDAETLPYLHGTKFSNSLQVPIRYKQSIPDRVSFLVDLARGKSVLHLGCLDHLPLIEGKIERRKWLHKELTEVASKCVGVDIDEETSKYVREKFGFSNIVISDFVRQSPPESLSGKWDYAILGELLEHIDNPVSFLESIRKNYQQNIGKVVITVPNAFTQSTFRMAGKSIELINSDHRYWFTPYTLAKVMHHAGIRVDEIHFANRIPLTYSELLQKKALGIIGKKPVYDFTYASSIIAIGSF
jgi:2-polyprenyl-3-methyl-5-hydroxy-6-metoxy-1,4-benzoquinol methylase